MTGRVVAILLAGLFVSVACGGDDGNGGGRDGGDGGAAPFELLVSPMFVQGLVPGEPVPVLVSVSDMRADAGEVALAATFGAGSVSVEPDRIAPGEVADVTLIGDAVTDDVAAELAITATRGSVEQTATREIIVVPFEDDRGPMAADILGIFTGWLSREHPELGITSEDEYESAMVAPRLLVVSHYMFQDDEYELGVSWHVMIAPDDWAELYLRPRDELRPTRAFRVSSWSAALAGDPVEFSEVPPPDEVVR